MDPKAVCQLPGGRVCLHSGQYTKSTKMGIRVRVPGFEPGISPPQGEVLTTILHTPGEAGYRSLYLSHAKRALYHLSYIPEYCNHFHTASTNTSLLTATLASPCLFTMYLTRSASLRIVSADLLYQHAYTNDCISYKALCDVLCLLSIVAQSFALRPHWQYTFSSVVCPQSL